MSTKISFLFHPNDMEHGLHAITKSENGVKRRYLRGISSGLATDLHGERMTKECIKSFQDQAKSGDVLLYEGQHGVNFTEDLGLLVDSEILPTGDWMTEYRLFDTMDGFREGTPTLDRADKLWRQMNGLKPYSKPKKKGFSIEGDIPDGGVKSVDSDGKRIMSDVRLDGVLVVPKPAYSASIVSAVYKAFGEVPPEVENRVREEYRSSLGVIVKSAEGTTNFYRKKSMLDDGLDEAITEIIQSDTFGTAGEKLRMLFDEYGAMMVELILGHKGVFDGSAYPAEGGGDHQRTRLDALLEIQASLKNELKKRGFKQ